MNGLLGMGLVGWLVSLAVGFVVGGVFFLCMKVQVDYVVKQQGPLWLVPVALYARLAYLAVVLILVAVYVPRTQLAAAVIGGLAGAILARVCVARGIKKRVAQSEEGEDTKGD